MDNFTDNDFICGVVKRYSNTIVRIAFQYMRNISDAEDIMQDVFLSFMRQPPFGSEEHLKAWLIRVTINKSKNCLKASKRRKTVPLDTVANSLTEKQAIMLVELQELSEKDRDIIYLFYYEGYTAKEIGKIIGKKEKAVLMRLSRSRERLKQFLDV